MPDYIRRRPCPDPAAALVALLRTQATAGPLHTSDVTINDFDSEDLARIDRAAQLAVAAREIHPAATARISTIRHAIADVIRIRQIQDAAQARAQAEAQAPQAPTTPPDSPRGNWGAPRPAPRPTMPPGGPGGNMRRPDDTHERQQPARQMADIF